MKKQSTFLVLTILSLMIILSQPIYAQGKTKFDLVKAKKDIEQVNQRFMDMAAKSDSAGIANLYTADAKLMFTGAPAFVGRASIQSAFGGILTSGVTKVDLKTIDVFGNDELLAEEGQVTIYVKEQVVGEEKYIVLWKKEDGKWKLFRDISNSNMK